MTEASNKLARELCRFAGPVAHREGRRARRIGLHERPDACPNMINPVSRIHPPPKRAGHTKLDVAKLRQKMASTAAIAAAVKRE
jgi:hypothetical protein